MKQFEQLKHTFIDPPDEFTPIPFWFWNDELTKEELIRQIRDFHSKEVNGFVIHPRMGMPREMPYLSESYMDLVEAAVAEADRLGMKVILYDEGMYPSGSACGMVVKENPDYASRGLQIKEFPSRAGERFVHVPISLSPDERLVSAQAIRRRSDSSGEYDADSVIILPCEEDSVQFELPDTGNWSVLLFVETFSQGTIRGVHADQDDGEPDAPLAADLLNPDAVKAFITLTHEKYYSRLSRYFGTTVIAMFTDEPDLLGRGHTKGLKPWTGGFMDAFIGGGGREQDLPALWLDTGEATGPIRASYDTAVHNRLATTYYKALADWCEEHGIALTGHPAESDDIGLLEHFHIPGQDVVWRYIAPEDGKAVTGVHSTMGKCSSDAARHRGRRRNLNECFGVCGIEGGWSLTADNMKWYLDWLFVRGVNLISPHAFYYSIRGERRDERPPDVGPNNIWWPEYALWSRYIKRMSWLMTDSVNGAETAILAGEAYLPWRTAKPLYENQIEFNYLEVQLLSEAELGEDGTLAIAGYRYKALIVEDGRRLSGAAWAILEAFVRQGGLVIELSEDGGGGSDVGQIRVGKAEHIPAELLRKLDRPYALEPAADFIRISRVAKNGMLFHVIVNEGEADYEGKLLLDRAGYAEYWRPWAGECEAAQVAKGDGPLGVPLQVSRRECLIVAIDPQGESRVVEPAPIKAEAVLELSKGWRVIEGPWTGELPALSAWNEWAGMEHYSGTVVYERSFELDDPSEWAGAVLDLGDAHELVRVQVNGKEAGVGMWSPYRFEIGQELLPGANVLRFSVTNSLANRYDGKSFPSGLVGPVRLYFTGKER